MAISNYITRTRQWEINNLIDDIHLSTSKSYPTDGLIDIISTYIPGVEVVEHDFAGDRTIRGAIYKKSKEFTHPLIAIQKNMSKEVNTFTLAHEFAHYCLNHAGKANYMIDKIGFDGSKRMQKEAEANYFAATLLMPVEKFSKLMNLLSVPQLAQRFGVSESAVRVRIAWLNGKKEYRAL